MPAEKYTVISEKGNLENAQEYPFYNNFNKV